MQVNYDRIAASYNRRFEADVARPRIAHALIELVQGTPAIDVLEVGCGTGHWLAQLHGEGCRTTGLDPSIGMLTQARQRALPGLRLAQGRGEQIPLAPQSFDVITCVNAIHHFDDGRSFIAESTRLLRPGGTLAVIGFDPHAPADEWYVYEYFAGTRETDRARFPSRGQILNWMLAAGFGQVACRPIDRIYQSKPGRAVLDDPFLQKNSCSQLALLTEEAYAAGLDRIHSALAKAEARGETLAFRTDNVISMLVGRI